MATDSAAYETFRSNARLIMNLRGINQNELADRTGMFAADVSNMLNGKVEPRISKVQRVADALGVEIGLLFNPGLSEDDVPEISKLSA